jgi:hypothetical protein
MFTIYSAPTHLYTDTVTPCHNSAYWEWYKCGLLLYAAVQCQVVGQWGSKHVAVCVLKRYCHCKEVRVFVGDTATAELSVCHGLSCLCSDNPQTNIN